MNKEIVIAHFNESIAAKQAAAEVLADPIVKAIRICAEALNKGNKILTCGNGGSAGDSQHFAAELVGRFERERRPLPAIALTVDSSILTAVSNDYAFEDVFSKQVEALGRPGDVLLAISTSGNSGNVLKAVDAAHAAGMTVIGLTGRDGGKIGRAMAGADTNICVPHTRTARIQEIHLLAIHAICDGIDRSLFGE